MKKLTGLLLTIALLIGSILSPQITQTTKAESPTNGLSENFDYTLQTIYGDNVSVSAETTKTKDVTMLIFGRTTCLNTLLEINDISNSDWISNPNINVIFIEIEQADLETNKTFANEYGCDKITFCYDTKATNYGILCKYTALMETTSTTLPVTVLVDHNNYIQNILTGYHSADDLFQEMNQFAEISAPQQPDPTTSPVKTQAPAPINTMLPNKPTDQPAIQSTKQPVALPTAQPTNTVSPKPSSAPVNTASPKPTDTPDVSTKYQLGDLDGNGTIDLDDAQTSLKFALAILAPQSEQEAPADINQDGKIDLDDSLMILKIALGIEQAPNGGQNIPNKNPSNNEQDKPSDNPSNNGQTNLENNISYSTQKIEDGIVCIVKNNNPYAVSIDSKSIFYKGTSMLDTRYDYNSCLEANSECVLFFLAPYDSNYNYVDYDDFKIIIETEEPYEMVHDAKGISVKSNFGADNVTAEITNNSGKEFEFIHTTILFYDSNGRIIDRSERYAECAKPGSVDYITYYLPYDSTTYETIMPDSYKIYVDYAYKYI